MDSAEVLAMVDTYSVPAPVVVVLRWAASVKAAVEAAPETPEVLWARCWSPCVHISNLCHPCPQCMATAIRQRDEIAAARSLASEAALREALEALQREDFARLNDDDAARIDSAIAAALGPSIAPRQFLTDGQSPEVSITAHRMRLRSLYDENEARLLPDTALRVGLLDADRLADEYAQQYNRPAALNAPQEKPAKADPKHERIAKALDSFARAFDTEADNHRDSDTDYQPHGRHLQGKADEARAAARQLRASGKQASATAPALNAPPEEDNDHGFAVIKIITDQYAARLLGGAAPETAAPVGTADRGLRSAVINLISEWKEQADRAPQRGQSTRRQVYAKLSAALANALARHPATSPAPAASPAPNVTPLDWGGLCKKCGRNTEPVPDGLRNEARLAGHKWWCPACGYPVGCFYYDHPDSPAPSAEAPFGEDAGPFCTVEGCQGEPTICAAHYEMATDALGRPALQPKATPASDGEPS